jgi:hypothetical protein
MTHENVVTICETIMYTASLVIIGLIFIKS